MGVQEPPGWAGAGAVLYCAKGDGRWGGLVTVMESAQGSPCVSRSVFLVPRCSVTVHSRSRGPVPFHTAGLAAAGGPWREAFIRIKRVLTTAYAISIWSRQDNRKTDKQSNKSILVQEWDSLEDTHHNTFYWSNIELWSWKSNIHSMFRKNK